MHMLSVGSPYDPDKSHWPEQYWYQYDRAGHVMTMFLRQPSAHEIEAIWQGPARFGVQVIGDVIWISYDFRTKAGRRCLDGEAPYSYHLVQEDRRKLPPLDFEPDIGAALSIILVNAEGGLVEALRVLAFSHRFSMRLHQAIHEQSARAFDTEDYHRQVDRVYAAYSSRQLMRQAEVMCKAGERDKPLFELGALRGTPGALEALEEAGDLPTVYLTRHQYGDWGELDPEDRAENDLSVKKGLRILSAYTLSSGVKIWIITEWDRSATTILLPDEY